MLTLLKKLFVSTNPQESQPRNRNVAVLALMRHVGFEEKAIRKALVELNGVNIARLSNGVAVPTLYGALKGSNQNQTAREILARSLDLNVEELFDGMGHAPVPGVDRGGPLGPDTEQQQPIGR